MKFAPNSHRLDPSNAPPGLGLALEPRLPPPVARSPFVSMSGTGMRPLTAREKQILRLVCDGLTNAEIALRLGIAPETVKSEMKRIFKKIEVKNRTQAAVMFTREGLLS